MKMSPFLIGVIAVVACGAGFGAGWIWRGGKEGEPAGPVVRASRGAPADSAAAPKESPVPAPANAVRDYTSQVASTELERMKTMSAQEFGIKMTDAWLNLRSGDAQITRGLYLGNCDAERAMAFYLELKRRKGLALLSDGWRMETGGMRYALVIAAKKDGAKLVQKMLEASPRGTAELDSVVHGWASNNPREAADWYNSLPPDAPYAAKALKGLIYGLGEGSPSRALEVFNQLGPEERTKEIIWGLANSAQTGPHGIKGLAELSAAVTDDALRQRLLSEGMEYGMEAPPADFVNAMAGPLETAPGLRSNYEQMAGRWVSGAPAEAMAWLTQNALKAENSTALSIVTAGLVRSGKGAEVDAWMAANPNAPGLAAVQAGKSSATAVEP